MSLPTIWLSTTIGDICTKVTDGSHNPPKATDSGLPMLSAKNIHHGLIDFDEEHRLIPNDEFEVENKRTQIAKDDVLLTIVGALGRTAVVQSDIPRFTLQRSVAVLRPLIDPRYFRYCLESPSFQKQILDNAKGTAQKGVYLKTLKSLEINIAPLAEQKIIADKLDILLAQVESIKARLERIPEILKQFRQSVLAAAVSGKLTEEWRIGAEVGLGSTVPIKEVAELNPKKPKIEDTIEVGFSPMTMASEGVSSDLGFEVRTWAEVKKGFTAFQNEDVLLAKITPCFENGKSAIPQNLPNGYGAGSTEFMVLRCSKNQILPKYLYFNLGTTSFLVQGEVNMTGSVGHKRVPKEFVGDWQIYLPTLSEQIEIIRKVELNFASAQSIEQLVQSALDRVNNLTQSILAKAFRGELTADWREANPELISGENSAEALLKRIKAERESAKPTTKRGRAKT